MRRAIVAGLRSIRRHPGPQLLAVGTIAVSLLLLLLVRLAARDLERLAAAWGDGVQMTVYLDEQATPLRGEKIALALARLPGVESVRRVEPTEAYARLRQSLGERADLLDGVEETLLPASIEVRLQPGVAEAIRVHPVFARLRQMPGVEDVELMADWVERVRAIERLLRFGGLALGLLVAAACLYVVGSTIRLAVFARREEIEILRLVGATPGFVQAPFLVEGTLQGLVGAGLALGALFGLYRQAAPWIESTLGSALCAVPLPFLPPLESAVAILGGGLLGLVGSSVAVSRHVRS